MRANAGGWTILLHNFSHDPFPVEGNWPIALAILQPHSNGDSLLSHTAGL